MSSPHTVIVGGSSGMGLATAKLLLEVGHKVSITGRTATKLEAARAQLGGDVSSVVMDAAAVESVAAIFAGIGPFDHLILALGSGKGVGPFSSIELKDVKAGFEEKFYAHFACAQAALPYLRPDGSITFIAGLAAHAAMPGTAGIGAANAAVAALVPILAVELQPMRVNAVSPGVVDTAWWDFLDEEQKAAAFAGFAQKTPAGRVGKSDDIAQTIAFLVKNTFVTGQTILCDGGLRWAS